MADKVEQIFIEFVPDASKIDGVIPTLQKMGRITEEDAKNLQSIGTKAKESFTTASTEGAKAAKTLKDIEKGTLAIATAFEKEVAGEVSSALSKAGVSLASFKKELSATGKSSAFDDLRGKIDQTNKTLLETAARMESLRRKGLVDTEGYKKLEKQLQTGKLEADRLAKSMDNVKASVTGFGTTSQDTAAKTQSLRGEINQTVEELARLMSTGQLTASEIYDIAQGAGALKSNMDDARKAVQVLAQDSTKLTFAATLQGLEAVAAGAQGLMGVQALLGSENEDLQKTLVKLNAVMAITQALQQIKIALDKQEALSLGLTVGGSKALAVANRITASTYAGLGVSVTATSTAFKVLRAAIITTGIGALVVGIGYLINKITEWTESTKSQAEAQEELNQKMEEYRQKLDEAFRESDSERMRQLSIKAIEREIKLLEAQGGSELKIIKLKEEKAALEIKSSKVRQATEQEFSKVTEEEAERQKDIANDLAIDKIKAAKNAADQQKKLNDEASKRAKDLAERNAQAEFQLLERNLKRQAEAAREISENEDNPWTLRIVALQDYAKISERILATQQAEELRKTDLTEKEKLNIVDKYNRLQDDVTIDAGKRRSKILASQFKDFEKTIEQTFRSGKLEFAKDLNNELAAIETVFKMGLLSVQEYEKAREETQDSYARKNTLNEIQRLQDLIANRKKYKEDATDLEEELYAAKDRLRQLDLAKQKKAEEDALKVAEERINELVHRLELMRNAQFALISMLSNSLRETIPDSAFDKTFNALAAGYSRIKQAIDEVSVAQQQYENKLISLAELNRVKQKADQEYIIASFATAQEMLNGIYASNKEARAADLQNQLDSLSRQREAELNNKNLTEEQKAVIEDRYRKQEAALKRAAWYRDRDASIQQAVINGLLAVTNALATVKPFYAALIASGVAAATTAYQVGKIRSTKPPAFKKGTKHAPRGYAWVGEEGPELVYLNGGEKIWNYRQSEKVHDAWRGGSVAHPDRILSSTIPRVDHDVISHSIKSQSGNIEIDYDKIGRSVAKNIPESAIVQNTMDAEGFTTYILKNGNKTQIRNSRYKIG